MVILQERASYPPEEKFGFKPRLEQEKYAMPWMIHISGQALMSALNYSCGREPSQPRHNDAVVTFF
jgi:hypothetical protein